MKQDHASGARHCKRIRQKLPAHTAPNRCPRDLTDRRPGVWQWRRKGPVHQVEPQLTLSATSQPGGQPAVRAAIQGFRGRRSGEPCLPKAIPLREPIADIHREYPCLPVPHRAVVLVGRAGPCLTQPGLISRGACGSQAKQRQDPPGAPTAVSISRVNHARSTCVDACVLARSGSKDPGGTHHNTHHEKHEKRKPRGLSSQWRGSRPAEATAMIAACARCCGCCCPGWWPAGCW